jgi:hypothetical protein
MVAVSIKFICSCGKHLRARDNMAARRSMCPRCGAPVGVPSLRPTHAGTLAAPMTPQERRQLQHLGKRPDALAEEPPATLTADLPSFEPPAISVKQPSCVRLPRQLETDWLECLAYPFFNGKLLLMLAFVLTLLSGAMILLIPQLPPFAAMSADQWLTCSALLFTFFLFLVLACAIVECALKTALDGRGPGAYLPSGAIAVLKCVLRWLICFLAGPLVLLALAGYFWLYGGDLTPLDCAIVAELLVLAIAYWLLAMVCSCEHDRLRDANPVRVTQLLHRLRLRAIVPVLIAPALACAHGAVSVFALAELHQHPFAGWLLLAVCWTSGLFMLAALLRLLGVWCYHSPRTRSVRVRKRASVAAAN